MKLYATEQGIENLKKEIEELKIHLERVRDDKNDAYHNMGDQWHDNPAFINLEQEEKQAYRHLMDKIHMLASVELYTGSNEAMTKVTIGSIIHLRDDSNNIDLFVEITGVGDSNPAQRKIRYDSPLANALLGATQYESREFLVINKRYRYKIMAFFESWSDALEYKKERNIV